MCIENSERKAIERALEDENREINEHLFDNAVVMVCYYKISTNQVNALQVKQILRRDPYGRFLESSDYTTLKTKTGNRASNDDKANNESNYSD